MAGSMTDPPAEVRTRVETHACLVFPRGVSSNYYGVRSEKTLQPAVAGEPSPLFASLSVGSSRLARASFIRATRPKRRTAVAELMLYDGSDHPITPLSVARWLVGSSSWPWMGPTPRTLASGRQLAIVVAGTMYELVSHVRITFRQKTSVAEPGSAVGLGLSRSRSRSLSLSLSLPRFPSCRGYSDPGIIA